MNSLHLEPKMITAANGEEFVLLTLSKSEWQQLETLLADTNTTQMPVFASLGIGESDLNGADSEQWLQENWQ
jgi:hypothetical protein